VVVIAVCLMQAPKFRHLLRRRRAGSQGVPPTPAAVTATAPRVKVGTP
jgi:hypothetical protein